MKFSQMNLEEKVMYVVYMTGKVTTGFVVMFIIACLN